MYETRAKLSGGMNCVQTEINVVVHIQNVRWTSHFESEHLKMYYIRNRTAQNLICEVGYSRWEGF